MASVTIAAFDFDNTLTRRDSVVPFLRRVAGTRRLTTGLVLRAPRVLTATLRRDRDALRALASEVALRGVTRAKLESHAADLAAQLIAGGLRDDTVARLRWHVEQGHRVVIVSASYVQYVEAVGAYLGVESILATMVDFDESDRCAGRILGANCRAEEKVRRLSAWMSSIGVTREVATIWAYGDSSGDRALLDFADHPVWVTEPLATVDPSVEAT
jgi:phosphatidylglycerophosphatase C